MVKLKSKSVGFVLRLLLLVLYYCVLRRLPSSDTPGGIIWRRVRFYTCRYLFAKCGNNVNIETRAFFGTGAQITIGENSGIGVNCRLYGKVTIGKNVMMAPDVVILTRHHEFAQTAVPMIEQGAQEERPVSIGDDVWIGTRVIILPGVSIGSGVIIGTGAVVTKSVSDWSIAAGNPARVVRSRRSHDSLRTGNAE